MDNRNSHTRYRTVTHATTTLTKYYKLTAFLLISVLVFIVILTSSATKNGANKNRSLSKDETRNILENSQGTTNHDEQKSLVQQPIAKIPLDHHLCNRGDEGSCECAQSDPMKPVLKNSPAWKRAFEMNLALLTNNTETGEDEELDVVLLGDSITEDWNGRRGGNVRNLALPIKDVFKTLFQKKSGGEVNGIALGISGDRNNNLLWRMRNGEVPDSLKAKVYWLLIGTNDLSTPKCSAELTYMGIIKCAEQLMAKKPNSIIVLNSILPRTDKRNGSLLGPHPVNDTNGNNPADDESFDYWPVINAINQELEKFAAAHDRVKFYNATDFFLKPLNGAMFINKDLMPDRLHPNAAGHQVWGNGIVNYLKNEIGV